MRSHVNTMTVQEKRRTPEREVGELLDSGARGRRSVGLRSEKSEKCQTPERKVGGLKPTSVLCP